MNSTLKYAAYTVSLAAASITLSAQSFTNSFDAAIPGFNLGTSGALSGGSYIAANLQANGLSSAGNNQNYDNVFRVQNFNLPAGFGAAFIAGNVATVTLSVTPTAGALAFAEVIPQLAIFSFIDNPILPSTFSVIGQSDITAAVNSNVTGTTFTTVSFTVTQALVDRFNGGANFEFYTNFSVVPGSQTTNRLTYNVSEFSIAPIPEPSSFAAIAGLGLLGFAALRRRQVR
jgi:hypothetical protein